MVFFYKKCFPRCSGSLASILYMFSGRNLNYSKKWCQDALDCVFRMVVSGYMDIDFFDIPPTLEEIKVVLMQLAEQSPNIIDGFAIWSTYQFYLTDAGQAFWDEWKKSDDDALYWQKLNHIFDEHHVGFDKSCFVPVKF